MRITRGNDESAKDFEIRACRYKEDNGLTWKEITDIINSELKQNYDESKYRKFYSAYQEGFAAGLTENSSEYSKDINEKLLKLQKEKVKIQSDKLANGEYVRKIARQEYILELVKESVENIKPIPQPVFHPLKKSADCVFIGGIADAHYGKDIVINGLDGGALNIYNPDVFEQRMWKLLRIYAEKIDEYCIEKIYFFDLGDAIEGILRASSLSVLKYGITESAIRYAEFMMSWLTSLSKFCQVDYFGCLGNHDEIRPLGTKSGEFGKENMHFVISSILKAGLANNQRINIKDSSEIQYIFVEGFGGVLATHGQNEKSLVQSALEYKEIYGKDFKLLLSGHLHNSKQETVGFNTKAIQLPSISGVDGYSMKLRKAAPAEARIIIANDSEMNCIDVSLD